MTRCIAQDVDVTIHHQMKDLESVPQPTRSPDQARPVILELRQRMAVMGANDSEFWTVDEILKKLDSGEIEPDQAVRDAHAILEGKQDYH